MSLTTQIEIQRIDDYVNKKVKQQKLEMELDLLNDELINMEIYMSQEDINIAKKRLENMEIDYE